MSHGNSKVEKRRRLEERFEVKFFVPPGRMVEIAAERTEGMAGFFMFGARSGQQWVEDLQTLVRSAYMQGINDMLEVIASGKLEEVRNATKELDQR